MRLSLIYFVASIALFSTACVDEPPSSDDDIDDAIGEDELGKTDSAGAYRHYLLWADPTDDNEAGKRYLARAGGGSLRCPDEVVRDVCELTLEDLVPATGSKIDPNIVFDELADHAVIVRGRMV